MYANIDCGELLAANVHTTHLCAVHVSRRTWRHAKKENQKGIHGPTRDAGTPAPHN